MATYIIKGKTAALDITIITDDVGNIKMQQGYGDTRDTVWITKEQRDKIEQLFTPTSQNFNLINPLVSGGATSIAAPIKGLHYLQRSKKTDDDFATLKNIYEEDLKEIKREAYKEMIRRLGYVFKN